MVHSNTSTFSQNCRNTENILGPRPAAYWTQRSLEIKKLLFADTKRDKIEHKKIPSSVQLFNSWFLAPWDSWNHEALRNNMKRARESLSFQPLYLPIRPFEEPFPPNKILSLEIIHSWRNWREKHLKYQTKNIWFSTGDSWNLYVRRMTSPLDQPKDWKQK